ncbi:MULTISPECIES: sensor histidine kinase [Rhodococcus]|uniref:histidine kinase n=2 Tax=Rhodococcus opacus TaxID=37919 RepID=A0AAX3YAF8_RHOOP|nr:HAMP domain-containing sensor histidine kinase [Rhodococcus opacus]NHU42676.1 HAMP domain-containing histidine kinase [Rhodococcus sp. A14]EKT79174.1 sensory receptor [Rhodococcus opacus M213]MBA8962336.1 signal transduction histidine kinase [Rhodococcus opacus]MBP2209135.1 signal transduction histidine kinase [Rhodococcus opacus]MCZ4584844.1 HAMP domain-containing sensor histidine kinase [Rhodococcus opacus]
MRRRVLAVLLVFAAVAVVAFAVPLALATSAGRTQALRLSREADATHFASLAGQTQAPGSTTLLREEVARYHELYGEGVLIVDARGNLRAGAGLSPDDSDVAAAVTAGLRNQKQGISGSLTPWSADRVLSAVPVGTGAQVDGAVVLDVSTRAARESIRTSWLVIVAGALVALAAVTAVAIALSRWTVRPLGALTARVGALTDAVPSPRPRVRRSTGRPTGRYSGPPEVQELAKAFDTMSGAVQASGQAQRQLIADTAHQLRNPLAALHIRLDSLGPHVSQSGAETYRRTGMEVDRLGGILDGLLALAVAESPAESADDETAHGGCDVGAVLADRADAWTEALGESAMDLVLREPAEPLVADFRSSHLAQVLDVLLSNAHKYAGRGSTVRIDTGRSAAGIEIRVSDDGVGVGEDEIGKLSSRFFRGSGAGQQGTGLGLSIATALVEGGGGALTIAAQQPHGLRVTLTLPAVAP